MVIFLSGTHTGDTMMGVARGGGGGTSCARRPRERRLRSFLRHERMAVALHLIEALHHSSAASLEPVVERREEEVEAEVVYDAPRGQEQPPPGMRPGSLSDPWPPQQGQPRSVTWLPGRPASLQSSWCRTRSMTTRPWLLERALDERPAGEGGGGGGGSGETAGGCACGG